MEERLYIIPSTFDPRLISIIPAAVAKAAMETGVTEKIKNFEIYQEHKTEIRSTVTI